MDRYWRTVGRRNAAARECGKGWRRVVYRYQGQDHTVRVRTDILYSTDDMRREDAEFEAMTASLTFADRMRAGEFDLANDNEEKRRYCLQHAAFDKATRSGA